GARALFTGRFMDERARHGVCRHRGRAAVTRAPWCLRRELLRLLDVHLVRQSCEAESAIQDRHVWRALRETHLSLLQRRPVDRSPWSEWSLQVRLLERLSARLLPIVSSTDEARSDSDVELREAYFLGARAHGREGLAARSYSRCTPL